MLGREATWKPQTEKKLYACLKVQHLEDCNTSVTHPMWTMFTA